MYPPIFSLLAQMEQIIKVVLFFFSQHCGKVLGLELIPEAVQDAKANAKLNAIDNCEFFTGKAEDILHSVLMRAGGEDIIAVVDPPRAGLRELLFLLYDND